MADLQQHRTDATTGDVLVALGRRFQQSAIPVDAAEMMQMLPMVTIALESLRTTQLQMVNRLGLAGQLVVEIGARPSPPVGEGTDQIGGQGR